MLEGLYLGNFRFTFMPEEGGIILPCSKSSLLLHERFKEILYTCSCKLKGKENCYDCYFMYRCPYAYMYCSIQERTPPKGFATSAAPFVWQPPLEKKTDYLLGEKINFNLILFGNGIELLHIFVRAFEKFAREEKEGFKGRLVLQEVVSENPLTGKSDNIYDIETGEIKTSQILIKGEDLETWAESKSHFTRLSIHFLTQTFLKYRKKYFGELHFYYFFREVLRRALSLSYLYLDFKELNIDYNGLMEKANDIEKLKDLTFAADTERVLSEADEEAGKGLLGKVEFAGRFSQILPLLKLGEFIHVGEKSEMGYGRYRIKSNTSSGKIKKM